MAYRLYTDKNEEFECALDVKNASLSDAKVRLVVESNDLNLVFNGKIANGKCSIPIKKLKGILQENTSGKIKLEVIVEDMYFSPWESDFIVEEHTSVKVQVAEQKISAKPSVQISEIKKEKSPDEIIIENLQKNGISKTNYKKKMNEIEKMFVEYFSNNKSDEKSKKNIIKEVLLKLK